MADTAFRVQHIIAIYQFGDGTYDVSVSYMGSGTPIEQRQSLDAAGVKGYVAELLDRSSAPTASEQQQQDDEQEKDDRVDEHAAAQHDHQQDQ